MHNERESKVCSSNMVELHIDDDTYIIGLIFI